MKIFLLILCLFLPQKAESLECQIANFKSENVTATSAKISWETEGPCFIKGYNIEAVHIKFKACPHLNNFQVKSANFDTKDEQATLYGLEPFSEYKIVIKGVDDNGVWNIDSQFLLDTQEAVPQVRPRNGVASPQVQAIHFSWSSPQPQFDAATCQKQKGQIDGFFVQLYGLDSWAPLGLIKQKKLPENAPLLYEPGLKPYSRYKLKVFVLNKNGIYNENLPLELEAQTRPFVPNAPIEYKAHPLSEESIHLRWQPSEPPTGQIAKYKVKYGPLADPMDWKAELEVANQTNYCSKMSEQFNFVCVEVHGLMSNTTYVFQVQSFNENVEKGSEFSPSFQATTDPKAQAIQIQQNPVSTIQDKKRNNESSTHQNALHLWVIIVSFCIIVILILVISALVYKIKKYKLKQKYETARPRVHPGGSAPQSLDVSALGSFYPSMSTIDYTVAYHVRDIQNRQLPEIPTQETIKEDLYENEPDLILTSTPKRQESSDYEGAYLKPTFQRTQPEQSSQRSKQDHHHATVIPTESYVSTVQLEAALPPMFHQPPRTISPMVTNEAHPLISITSTSTII